MSLSHRRQRFENKSARSRRIANRRRSAVRGFQSLESRIALSVTPTGETLSFTEGASSAPVVATFTTNDEAPPVNAFTALISWGDGVTDAGTISPTANGFAVTGKHTYADETASGSPLPVAVTIFDTIDATSATANSTANVAEDDAGTLVAQTITPTEGAVFSGSLATFTDIDTAQTAGDFSAMIDWGDGATTAGTVSGGAGTFTISGAHAYSDEGTFTVLASFADDSPSTLGATITSTASVAEGDAGTLVPQTITPTEGTTFSGAVATFTDFDAGQTAGDFSAAIDWGDGATTAG
ncbi:MAG TPA: hypothetical protein VGN42_05775, partial [Pirellulales bacterium]|nr:hypothetical protein [Pirellulales bacterium]